MDETHLLSAVLYVELNPVVAGLCRRPEDWAWSSARPHIRGANDDLMEVAPMLSRIDDWTAYLSDGTDAEIGRQIHEHGRTGRPLGDQAFVNSLERITDRNLKQRRRGPKKKA